MAIEIETYGTRDDIDGMKAAFGPDVEVTVHEREPAKPAEESKPDEKPPEESKEVDNTKAAETNKEEESKSEEGKPAPDEKKGAVAAPKGKEKEKPESEEEKGGWTKRLNKVIDQRDAAVEEANRLKRELEEAKKVKPGTSSETKETTPQTYSGKPKPTREQFANSEDPDADFNEAMGRWGAAEEIAKDNAERRTRDAVSQRETELGEFNARAAETVKRHDDYHQVLKETSAQITEVMEGAILESEVGPDIMYVLAADPELAAKIVAMKPEKQLVEIGKLEARIEEDIKAASKKSDDKGGKAKDEKKPDPPPKKSDTKAPEPPSRIKPSAAPQDGHFPTERVLSGQVLDAKDFGSSKANR